MKRKAKVSSRMSDSEIREKLEHLGFIGEVTQKTKKEIKPKITKKKEASVDIDTDIVKKIKELKKLFDDGVLTKEEFTKAKKKILN